MVNKLLAGTEFSPACDAVNPGAITLLITASANGPQAKTETLAKLLPEGKPVKVAGTNPTQFYFASQQMNAFNKAKGEMPVNGRVVDLAGNMIKEPLYPMEVSLNTPYGAGCQRTTQVPVTDGFFDAGIL